ncbi:MAG: hypothetical protein ACTSPY_04125 [Candidatus Helarchaeota archaeon]
MQNNEFFFNWNGLGVKECAILNIINLLNPITIEIIKIIGENEGKSVNINILIEKIVKKFKISITTLKKYLKILRNLEFINQTDRKYNKALFNLTQKRGKNIFNNLKSLNFKIFKIKRDFNCLYLLDYIYHNKNTTIEKIIQYNRFSNKSIIISNLKSLTTYGYLSEDKTYKFSIYNITEKGKNILYLLNQIQEGLELNRKLNEFKLELKLISFLKFNGILYLFILKLIEHSEEGFIFFQKISQELFIPKSKMLKYLYDLEDLKYIKVILNDERIEIKKMGKIFLRSFEDIKI